MFRNTPTTLTPGQLRTRTPSKQFLEYDLLNVIPSHPTNPQKWRPNPGTGDSGARWASREFRPDSQARAQSPRVRPHLWQSIILIACYSFGVCCFGGPALIYYVSPTEEELFLKYNPDLQKRSLENRVQKQQDFDNFVMKLRELSKSDKPSKLVDSCAVG